MTDAKYYTELADQDLDGRCARNPPLVRHAA